MLAVITILIAIIIDFIVAGWFSEIAELKGYDSKKKHIFGRCFWLGIAGWLYTIALPNRNISFTSEGKLTSEKKTLKNSNELSEKKEKTIKSNTTSWTCKSCGKENSIENKVCSSCGTVNYELWDN